ncbi:recombinase family protein [Streptomyces sp. CA-288835]|uniref:recombinase family protein n=1 Tax=Streptomyces sp. CA-288835 TaxID=3240069 RepID=UPI003D8F1A2B
MTDQTIPTPTDEAPTSVGRLRVVLYLCGAPNADISAPRRKCREYAEAFGWEITAEIEDHDGLNEPDGRVGLAQAIERIRGGEAGALLTPWRSMISPVQREYNEVNRKIESAGGFLEVQNSDLARASAAR